MKMDIWMYILDVYLFHQSIAEYTSTLKTVQKMVEESGDWEHRNRLNVAFFDFFVSSGLFRSQLHALEGLHKGGRAVLRYDPHIHLVFRVFVQRFREIRGDFVDYDAVAIQHQARFGQFVRCGDVASRNAHSASASLVLRWVSLSRLLPRAAGFGADFEAGSVPSAFGFANYRRTSFESVSAVLG